MTSGLVTVCLVLLEEMKYRRLLTYIRVSGCGGEKCINVHLEFSSLGLRPERG
jgi:hypothetical protein